MTVQVLICLSFLATPAAQGDRGVCDSVKVVNKLVGWGYKTMAHSRKIDAIIIHSSYNSLGPDSFSIDGVLREYRSLDVAPHYIIDRAGTVYRLVPDNDIAYQAGKSRLPDGATDVNAVSIGIEIINTINDSPTEAQYISLSYLVRCLGTKYRIKYILGHKDIAPGRKTDPWNFNWRKFRELLDNKSDHTLIH